MKNAATSRQAVMPFLRTVEGDGVALVGVLGPQPN